MKLIEQFKEACLICYTSLQHCKTTFGDFNVLTLQGGIYASLRIEKNTVHSKR